MTTETIEITTPDGVADALFVRPDEGDHPAVLLFMDAFGIRPQIQEMAERIAGWGYTVLAPNLFYRDGVAAELAPKEDLSIAANREAYMGTLMPRMRGFTLDQSGPDIEAYVATLLGMNGVSGTAIGTTGYCMGGALSMRTAAAMPDKIAASGSFHGGNLANDRDHSPHRLLAEANPDTELYFGHADQDASMPTEAIELLESTLTEAGLAFTSELYPGALHGYTMADTSQYQEAGAERHYSALQDLFGRNL